MDDGGTGPFADSGDGHAEQDGLVHEFGGGVLGDGGADGGGDGVGIGVDADPGGDRFEVGRAGERHADPAVGGAQEVAPAVRTDSAVATHGTIMVVDSVDDAIAETRRRWPLASTAYEVLMASAPFPSVDEGLVAESLVYSALQAGPEFAAWRSATPVKPKTPNAEPAVMIDRHGDVLHVILNRPERRNALGVDVRDGLLDAFAIAAADPTLRVEVRGAGPSFCAGGDLDEFGTFPSPEEAHTIRLQTSIGAAITKVADRVTFFVHGACYGSGIELPAFAWRVVATPDTTFALPELSLGLIPGAGGTVSMTARIGQERMLRLGLSRQPIDAETALAWGLVDAVAEI